MQQPLRQVRLKDVAGGNVFNHSLDGAQVRIARKVARQIREPGRRPLRR
jgi:hypothetical protein